jgi:hypothetical protein
MAKSTRSSRSAAASPALKLSFKLDAKKIAQIQQCLKKGRLTITLSKVDPSKGRPTNGYLYD